MKQLNSVVSTPLSTGGKKIEKKKALRKTAGKEFRSCVKGGCGVGGGGVRWGGGSWTHILNSPYGHIIAYLNFTALNPIACQVTSIKGTLLPKLNVSCVWSSLKEHDPLERFSD